MCGIIGYTGTTDAVDILLNGLSELEYRGYDSAGISLLNDGKITTIKTVGKVAKLKSKVSSGNTPKSTCGIGHTRWATHGGVCDVNAHPHTVGAVTLIHNGIIENYHEIADDLSKTGHLPVSQTDTEIAAMLIESLYEGNPKETIKKAVEILDGAYAFCIMFEDHPNVIYSIRNCSPLVAVNTPDGSFIASDMTALIKYSKDYFVIPEQHIVELTPYAINVTTLDGVVVTPKILHVNWDITSAQKNGYEYFMHKEIYDQPDALHQTIAPRIVNGLPDFEADSIPNKLFKDVHRVVVTACGTAMYAGLIGKNIIEKLVRIPVTVEVASEFRYQNPILDKDTLVIIISQSGETADSLAALRLAKSLGARTLSVVNVKGSTIARESDYVFYTHAGPEIAVASTKAFSVQMSGMYLVALKLAEVNETCSVEKIKKYTDLLQGIIAPVTEALKLDNDINEIAKSLVTVENSFFIGRGLDYPMCYEGSLKLKEISYIHSEAYAAGELKHGTISLITEGIPVIAIVTQPDVSAKIISNIREVKARGAKIILITTKDITIDESLYDSIISLPVIDKSFTPFIVAIAIQLLAFHTSKLKGLDVDQPRNLAKSVTVE